MGTDIYGWVEVKNLPGDGWNGVIQVSGLIERQYGVFARLFDVRNYYGVTPIAPGRGLPPYPSEQVGAEYAEAPSELVALTWISWQELSLIDWDTEDLGPAEIHRQDGRQVHRRRELLPGWRALFKMLAILADEFGPDNVRLTVWFDYV